MPITMVLPVFYWEETYNNKSTIMTAAVQYKGMNFGLSFPVDENVVRKNMDKKKLVSHMKEISSVLTFHGDKVLDNFKQIDPKLVNEQEATRFYLDPIWDKRVNAFNKLFRVKEITREKAVELKLL